MFLAKFFAILSISTLLCSLVSANCGVFLRKDVPTDVLGSFFNNEGSSLVPRAIDDSFLFEAENRAITVRIFNKPQKTVISTAYVPGKSKFWIELIAQVGPSLYISSDFYQNSCELHPERLNLDIGMYEDGSNNARYLVR